MRTDTTELFYSEFSQEVSAQARSDAGAGQPLARAVRPATAQGTKCADVSAPQRTSRSLAIDPYDDRIVYVGIEGEGYFKTKDDGVTWTRIVDGIKAFPKTGGGFCYAEFVQTVSILAIRNMSASRWPVVPAPPISRLQRTRAYIAQTTEVGAGSNASRRR